MAHSCVEQAGRHAFIRDVDLVLALRLIEASPRANGFAFPEDWRDELENLVAGAIDLDLDRHLAAPEARDAFVRAIEAARVELAARDGVIPGEEIDALMGGPSGRLTTPDLPPERVIATLNSLLEVIGVDELAGATTPTA